ncbi:MAG TPA: adenylate/guanylate cyclase domain-containing protein, partial [Chloroflexota bacterium]
PARQAVSARVVSMLRLPRRLASSVATELLGLFLPAILAPGLQLAIQRLAFLFTDLTGSTALYQKVGQARAFRLVQDHFRILFQTVDDHRGAVVKTIGDAVMGAFPTGADAVACALAMQRAIRDLDTGGAIDPSRLLKIGLHEGPCIAVTANGRLDYFGTTINTAARVEHECRGGQIVITGEVQRDPAVQEILGRAGLAVETAEVQLRGVSEPVRIFRIVEPAVEPGRAGD